MDGRCVVLSNKSSDIDYRPPAQHKLFLLDKLFDFRFNSFLRCESFLNALYTQVLQDSLKKSNVTENLRNDIFTCNESSNGVSASIVFTSLSDPDRHAMIDLICQSFQSIDGFFLLDSRSRSYFSTQDFLIDMRESFELHSAARMSSGKRRSTGLTRSSSSVEKRELDDPVRSLERAMSLSSSPTSLCGSLVVVVRNAEQLDPEIFEGVLTALSSSTLKVHFLLFHAQLAVVHILFTRGAKKLLRDVPASAFLPPFHLYDELMKRALAAREVPVSLPSRAIAWIQESFWRSNYCVKTNLNKMLTCLSYHFEHRCSVLCMFEDSKWISDMLGAKTKDCFVESQNVSALMFGMTVDDLKLTGLPVKAFNAAGQIDPTCISDIYRMLCQSLNRSKLEYFWFQFILVARDFFLKEHRMDYTSDIIFAAVMSDSKPTKPSLIRDFIRAVEVNLRLCPLGSVAEGVRRMISMVSQALLSMPQCAEAIICFQATRNDLEDVRLLLEEVLDMMKQSGFCSSLTLKQLSKTQNALPATEVKVSSHGIDTTDSADQAEVSAAEPEAALMEDLEISAFCENVMLDLMTAIKAAHARFQDLPARVSVPGVLELSDEDLSKAMSSSNGTLRFKFCNALTKPGSIVRGLTTKPDDCVIMDQVMQCTASESIHRWYEDFVASTEPWPARERAKKRRAGAEQPHELSEKEEKSVQMRCRFARALNNACVAGLVTVRNSSTVIRREIYSWLEDE